MAQQREFDTERIRGKGKAARRNHLMNQFDDDCEWKSTARNILAQHEHGEEEVVETEKYSFAEGEAF